MCKAMPQVFRVWGLALAEHPEGSKDHAWGFDNKLSRSCTLVDLQDVYTTRMEGPYILRVIVKIRGVWGCESEVIKGVYSSSKHRVRGRQQSELITIWGNRVGV